MPAKLTWGCARVLVLALAILADVAPLLVEGQGTGMGMVNGVGPNNSTVKATRLVRSRKVPFNGPESSAPYVVVYFFCALVTLLSCAGIAVTEYRHRRFRKDNAEAVELAEREKPAGMPPRATLFLPPSDPPQQQQDLEAAPQSADLLEKGKSMLEAGSAPMLRDEDAGVKKARSMPVAFKSMSGLLDKQKLGLLQMHTPRHSEQSDEDPPTSARRMSEDEKEKARLMLDASHSDHMYMDSTVSPSTPNSGFAGGPAASLPRLDLPPLTLDESPDANMSMEDPTQGVNLSPTTSSLLESSTLGPLPPMGEGLPVLASAAKVGYRRLSSAPSPDRSSVRGTPPPDVHSSMQSLVGSLAQRHARNISLDGSGSQPHAFGSVLSSGEGSSKKFDDAESVGLPFGSTMTGYGPSRDGVSRRGSGSATSASNSAVSAASYLPSGTSTHNYSMPGSTVDGGSSAPRHNFAIGAIGVQSIETMRLNMGGVDTDSSVAPPDSSQAAPVEPEEAGSAVASSTVSGSQALSDTTALLGNNNGTVQGDAADAFVRLLAESSGDGSLQETLSGPEEIGPDDVDVLETTSLLGNK